MYAGKTPDAEGTMNGSARLCLILLGSSIALAGCAATTRCTGTFPKPGENGIYTCHDVSMTEEEAATADSWSAELAGGVLSLEKKCAYWTQKLEQTPASSAGLLQYVQVNRAQDCAEKESNERNRAKREAEERESGKPWIEMANAEISHGTCDPGHREALEQVLMRMKTNLTLRRDEGGTFHAVLFVDHRILVATEKGASFEFSGWESSTVHVFAIAALPVSLEVQRGGDRITLQSPWARWIHFRTTLMGAESNAGTVLEIVHPRLGEPPGVLTGGRAIALDSRVVQARADEALTLTVKGRGCALLAAFRDLN
jgi:hypothetical protein